MDFFIYINILIIAKIIANDLDYRKIILIFRY